MEGSGAFVGKGEGRIFSPTASIIEFLLRWASISYAAGFLTVMVNTANLGIPVLQLVEPVLVWVGLPLAIVIWAIFRVRHLVIRRHNRMREKLDIRKQQLQEIEAFVQSGRFADAYARIVGLSFRNIAYITVLSPVGNDPILTRIQSVTENLVKKVFEKSTGTEGTQEEGRQIISEGELQSKDLSSFGLDKWIRRTAKVNIAISGALAVSDFLQEMILATLLITVLVSSYVFFIYPHVPQKWGGGKAVSIRMILAEDKIPLDDSNLQQLFGISEGKVTQPINLLYATEHAYFVRLPSGPVIQLSSEAVSGIIYVH